MKKSALSIVALLLLASHILAQNVQELPIRNDFSLFYGTEIWNIYPGWTEGNGYENPAEGESAWYSSNVLFDKAVGVSFSGNIYAEWLITPRFEVMTQTKLSFDAALTRFYDDPALGHFGYDDSLSVMLSKDGINYQVLFSFTQLSALTAAMKPYEINLGDFAGETVNLAFFATDGAEPTGFAAFHMDNLVIKNAKATDAAICGINKPMWNSCLTDSTPVEICLKNDGTQDLWNVPVRVRLRGENVQNRFSVWQGPLSPGGMVNFVAAWFDLSQNGDYQISAQIEWDNDGDVLNNFSDTVEVRKMPVNQLPLPEMQFTGFYYDNLDELYGWYEARGKNLPQAFIETDWQGEMFSGSRAASVYFINLGTEDWLVGPIIQCSPNTSVQFKAGIRPEVGANMGSDDKFALMVSPDCGATWVQANAVTAADNLDTVFSNFDFSLAAFAGQEIRIAFYATTGNTQNFEKYLFYLDDILVSNRFDRDLALTEILSPANACSYGPAENLSIRILNAGRQIASGFQVQFALNAASPISETINQTILPGEFLDYTFAQTLDLSQNNENQISVSVLWTLDQNIENNQIKNHLIVPQSFNLATQGTYLNGFEETSGLEGWAVENTNNDVTSWVLLNNAEYAFQGTNSYFFSSNNSAINSNDWLFSPCFGLEAGQNYTVKFYYRNRATSYPEKLRLKIGNSQHSASMNQTITDLGPITNSTYSLSQTIFTVPASGSWYFGWQAYGDPDMFAMHIDNVEIFQVFETDAKTTAINVQRIKDQNCMLTGSDTLFIDILNQGTQNIGNIAINVKLNQEEVVSLSFNQTISPGQTVTIKFPIHLNAETLYTIAAWTQLAGDFNVANDTALLEDFLLQNFKLGFEPQENTAEWTQISMLGSNFWGIVNDQSVSHSGSQCFGIRTDGASGNTANNDWLFSECFYLEAGKCYELRYFYRSRYSTENLQVFLGNSASIGAMNLLYDLGDFNSNIYLESNYVFGVEEDGVYYLGWNTEGGTSGRYWIYIDDVSLTESNLSPVAVVEPHVFDREVFFETHFENISQVSWDFGDGSISETLSPSHLYQNAGEYTVTLVAQNLCGQLTQTYDIIVDFELLADFEFTTDSSLLSCNATTNAVAYEWDFGDGKKANGANVQNVYSQPGTYNVKLTTYSGYGLAVIEKTIRIDFLGIVETKKTSVLVFPNPAEDVVNIVSKEVINSCSILDIFGKQITKENWNKSTGKIQLSCLPAGVYFLKFESNANIQIVKIIKKQ